MIWADRAGLAVAALVAFCAGLFTGVSSSVSASLTMAGSTGNDAPVG